MGYRQDDVVRRELQRALIAGRPATRRPELVEFAATRSRWRVDVRVARDQLQRLGLGELEHVPGVVVREYPPAPDAIAEAEVTIPVDASRADVAERVGRRIVERLGYAILTSRARR